MADVYEGGKWRGGGEEAGTTMNSTGTKAGHNAAGCCALPTCKITKEATRTVTLGETGGIGGAGDRGGGAGGVGGTGGVAPSAISTATEFPSTHGRFGTEMWMSREERGGRVMSCGQGRREEGRDMDGHEAVVEH